MCTNRIIHGLWLVWALAMAGCADGPSPQTAGVDGQNNPSHETGGISDIPNPSREMAAKSGKSFTAIQRGHEVFMLKCGECHYYMMPEKVDLMDWEDAVPEMIRHAGMGRTEEKAVLDYVIAVRSMHGLRD